MGKYAGDMGKTSESSWQTSLWPLLSEETKKQTKKQWEANAHLLYMVRLCFDKGTLLLKSDIGTPYEKWDPRVSGFRTKALYYRDVLAYLRKGRIAYEDSVQQLPPRETIKSKIKQPQPRQENQWTKPVERGLPVFQRLHCVLLRNPRYSIWKGSHAGCI